MNNLSKVAIVAKYTFLEILRSKIIVNTLFVGLGILILSYIATTFTFGVPERVALDVGLGVLTISSVAIAIFMGVTLITKEIESRTVYMVLSRPLSRWAFLLGKLLGMGSILFLNVLILAIFSLAVYGFFGGVITDLIIFTILFCFLEALIVLSIVTFFSLLTMPVLSVIYTIAIYIAAHATEGIKGFITVKNNLFFSYVVDYFFVLFPNLERINFKEYVLYNQSIDLNIIGGSLIYAVCYFAFVNILSAIIFQKKNLD